MLDARRILKTNFNKLFSQWKTRTSGASKSRMAFAEHIGIGDGTLGRILYESGNTTLEVLVKLSEHAGVEPWQLLAPNLGEPDTTSNEARDTAPSEAAKRAMEAIVRLDQAGPRHQEILMSLTTTIELIAAHSRANP